MKIQKNHHPGLSPINTKVFRVDDEIEVLVHDVDLKSSRSTQKSKLRESLELVLSKDPQWLGATSSLVLAGRSYGYTSKPSLTKQSIKRELGLLVEVVSGSRKPNKDLKLRPKRVRKHYIDNRLPYSKAKSAVYPRHIRYNTIDIHESADLKVCELEDCISKMSDFKTGVKMTPVREVVVVYSEEEDDDDDVVKEMPEFPQNAQMVISSIKTSPILERSESPPTSLKESVSNTDTHVNGENIVCKDELLVQELFPEDNVRNLIEGVPLSVKQELNEQTQVLIKKRKSSKELDLLYVSLKEIPWAQSWSPKTFLGKSDKTTFPKRKVVKRKEQEKLVTKNRPTLLVKSNHPLQRGRPKKPLTANKVGRPKLKLSSKSSLSKNVSKVISEDVKRKRIKTESGMHDPNKTEAVTKKRSSLWKYLNSSKKTVATSTAEKTSMCHKLSTNLAIKQYDASKMCKVKSSPKRKFNTQQFDLNNCSKKNRLIGVSLPPTNFPVSSAVKPLVSAATIFVNVPPVTGVPAHKLKDLPNLKTALDNLKPRLKVSPKILPYTASTTASNCVSATATSSEGPIGSANGSSSVGSDLLLQKQLVSVLGKEQTEQKKRKLDDESLRYSVRQSECAFRYKEIAVKKHSNFIQIILVPNRSRHNGLTLEALQELREALISAKKDASCKVLLLNSSGSVFCSGLDLGSLVGHVHMPQKMSQAVRSLIETLALFSKPVVAAVNGAAVGLGVTLLAYCDVVFASEKATFFTPYARLGHIPEGAMTLVLPQVVGSLVASDMLLRGRKLTAFQASIYGLVSEVLWPSQFMESVIPRVQAMASQSGQAMESTKVLLRYHQWDKLQSTLENECRLLPKQWLSLPCQRAFKEALSQPGGLID